MAIEPLSSAMSYQAQPIQNAQSVRAQNTDRPAAEYTEGTGQEAAQIDSKTVVVAPADEKEGGNNSSYNQTQSENTEKKNLDKIRKAVDDLNKKMSNSEALFGIHEETNRVTIKIVDRQTKEVIKELPPEKTLDMIAKVWEMAGLMVDERR